MQTMTTAPRRALQELSRNHQATTSYAAVVRQAQTTNNPTPLLNPLPRRPSTLQVEQMIARAQQEALQQRQVQRVLFQNQARVLNHRQQQRPNNHRISSSSNRHQPTPFEVEEEEGSGSDILVDLEEIPPAQPREPTRNELLAENDRQSHHSRHSWNRQDRLELWPLACFSPSLRRQRSI